MARTTGTYQITHAGEETVRAFVPARLPPLDPALRLDEATMRALAEAMTAVGKLAVAADMVPSADWFLYGFVRKEALITSQICTGSSPALTPITKTSEELVIAVADKILFSSFIV